MDVYAVGTINYKKRFFFTQKIISLCKKGNDVYVFDDYKSAACYATKKKMSVFKIDVSIKEASYLSSSSYPRSSDIGSLYPCYRFINDSLISHPYLMSEEEDETNEVTMML